MRAALVLVGFMVTLPACDFDARYQQRCAGGGCESVPVDGGPTGTGDAGLPPGPDGGTVDAGSADTLCPDAFIELEPVGTPDDAAQCIELHAALKCLDGGVATPSGRLNLRLEANSDHRAGRFFDDPQCVNRVEGGAFTLNPEAPRVSAWFNTTLDSTTDFQLGHYHLTARVEAPVQLQSPPRSLALKAQLAFDADPGTPYPLLENSCLPLPKLALVSLASKLVKVRTPVAFHVVLHSPTQSASPCMSSAPTFAAGATEPDQPVKVLSSTARDTGDLNYFRCADDAGVSFLVQDAMINLRPCLGSMAPTMNPALCCNSLMMAGPGICP